MQTKRTPQPRGFSTNPLSFLSVLDRSFRELDTPIKQEKPDPYEEDLVYGEDEDEEDYEPLTPEEEFEEELEEEEEKEEESPDNPPLISLFKKPGTYIVTGNTGSGKSVMVEHVVKRLVKEDPKIFGTYVFSSSAELNDDYDWVPEDMIFSNQTTIDRDLTNFFSRRHNEQIIANKKGQTAMPCIAIVDDPTGTFKNLHGTSGQNVSSITEWVTKLRKTNTYLFLICQRWNSYSTIARDNNNSMVFFAPGQEELEACYRDSNLSMPKKDFFHHCSLHFKKKFTFLVSCDKKVYLFDPIKY